MQQEPGSTHNMTTFTPLYILIVVISVIIPPVGIVIGIIAHIASKSKTNRLLAKIAWITGSVMTIVIAALIYWLMYSLIQREQHSKEVPNVASEKIQPLLHAIKQSGAETICESGYDGVSGLNFDYPNSPPSYRGYFRMKNATDTRAIVDTYNTSAPSDLKLLDSYGLEVTTPVMGSKGPVTTERRRSDAPTADMYYSNYSDANEPKNPLSITEARHRSVYLTSCGESQKLTALPERPLVEVSFTFRDFKRP